MKQFNLVTLICLQLVTSAALVFTIIKTVKTETLVIETRKSLQTTIKVMADIDNQNKAAIAEQEAQKKEVKMVPLAIGSKAPNFSLKDENNVTVTLSDYKGKKVALVLSDPGCENCDQYYPVINQYVKQNNAIDVLILEINSTVAQNKALKAQKGIHTKLLAMPIEDSIKYGINATPTTIIVDKNGIITGTKVCTTLDELMNLISQP